MTKRKIALVTGAPGMDSFYLTKLLLSKGYEVWATHTYSSTSISLRFKKWDHLEDLQLAVLDITDSTAVHNFINTLQPDEVYNLAAKSHVHYSFEHPISTFMVDAMGPLYFLEAIRRHSPQTKFYQASTSELWGSNFSLVNGHKYQHEDTPFSPNSPYAAAKMAAHNLVRIYRESYNIWACCGILHNHTSPMRGEEFVEQKIAKWVANFYKYRKNHSCSILAFDRENIVLTNNTNYPKLRLGNVDAVRDFSHSSDMVEGMWRILNHTEPKDFVLASEEGKTIRHVLKVAFNTIGISNYNDYWMIDPKFFRPCEVDFLQGSAAKAREELGWSAKVPFNEIIKELVHANIEEEVHSYS